RTISIDAEDLAQDTVARALRYETHFEPGTNLRAWLTTMMRRIASTERQKRGRELPTDPLDFWPVPCASSPETSLDAREVVEAIDRLPARMRAAIRAAAQGYDQSEIASALAIPPGTVKSRVHRARTALQEIGAA